MKKRCENCSLWQYGAPYKPWQIIRAAKWGWCKLFPKWTRTNADHVCGQWRQL